MVLISGISSAGVGRCGVCRFTLINRYKVRRNKLSVAPRATAEQQLIENLSSHVDRILLTLADIDPVVASTQVVDTANQVAAGVSSQVVDTANQVAEQTSNAGGGPFSFITDAFESILKVLDSLLVAVNVPYSYGFAIILLTVLVKIATFPLTKVSVESSLALQQLQPRMKELQDRYAGNQEQLQQETAKLYKNAGVNPLAGCLPTLATIPVFIGLYRALTKAADDGLLTEGFFWIPSLGGPTTMSAQKAGAGMSWLLPFKDGAPPVGWNDGLAYLSLPILLVISQYISQQIVSPPQSDNPQQAATQNVLKFIPIMIGWFSLNVPSGLALYWLTNNIISTGQQVWLKRSTKVSVPEIAPPPPSQTQSATIVKPKTIDVEPKKPSGRDMGSRRSKQKGEKFRSLKAKEAAKKAAQAATTEKAEHSEVVSSSTSNGTSEITTTTTEEKDVQEQQQQTPTS
eukprot:TRINITY_DN539_c1_g3_i1.p1 TRINITY_DN539_c1_g3~~TRINITY_DN539_c1_g3_i1.p1  ORF type:complete len:458 (+),score=66.78 TRINITY_DN539_c1_g3_i1:68-1441(+)